MSGTCDYSGLSKRYGNFCVPAYKIKINGVDVAASMKLSVVEIKACLVLEGTSIVEIRIGDAYSDREHAFDRRLKDKFILGTVVELEMGYGSDTSCVFVGYVAMVGAEFREFALFVVTLMDARRLMMVSGSKQVLHDVKNYSDAFRTVIGSYSALCKPRIDATDDKLNRPISQNGNDYEFIMDGMIREGKADREFFIFGGTAYFRKPRSVKAPLMNMKYGQVLLSLSVQEEYLDQDIEVIGYSSREQKTFVGKARAKSSSRQKSVVSVKAAFTLTDPDADSQQKAGDRAAAVAAGQMWRSRSGEGETIGLPEMVPGRYFKVSGLEAMADNQYYITEVVHTLNHENYLTSFTIGGWE